MGTAQLVTMANDIAAFFAAASDAGEASKSVAVHLRRYWDPRMRKQIVQYVTRVARDSFRSLVPQLNCWRRISLDWHRDNDVPKDYSLAVRAADSSRSTLPLGLSVMR